jgi:hypothetical protein
MQVNGQTLPLGQIAGTQTNDDARAGNVGEYLESEVLSGAALSITNATPSNIASLSLTPGDWDVWGIIGTVPAGGTTTSFTAGGINTTSATLPTSPGKGANVQSWVAQSAGTSAIYPVGCRRISLNATTTVYLVQHTNFAVSTNAAFGILCARRVR